MAKIEKETNFSTNVPADKHKSTELFETITWLKAFLCLAVVIIHTPSGLIHTTTENPELFYTPVPEYLTQLARIAVPLFFAISGFLFFRSGKLSLDEYFYKIKRRLKSLLIPFFIWNFYGIFVLFCSATFFFFILNNSDRVETFSNFSGTDWINFFLGFENRDGRNVPANTVLWFIRDLMICIVASPIIYQFIKRTKLIGLIFLAGIWTFFVNKISFPESLPGSIFFFSTGTVFALNYKQITSINFDLKKIFFGSISLYLLLPLIPLFLKLSNCNFSNEYFTRVINIATILLGIVAIIIAMIFLKKRIGVPSKIQWLGNASFFVYCFHGMFAWSVLQITNEFFLKLLPHNCFFSTMLYFFNFILIVTTSLLVYTLTKKLFPRVCAILCGGR